MMKKIEEENEEFSHKIIPRWNVCYCDSLKLPPSSSIVYFITDSNRKDFWNCWIEPVSLEVTKDLCA
jgi:hypothetical protein